jgi:Domain of unknown function (DUF6429)
MAIDWAKVDEMTLALLHLTTFKERGGYRAWKGHAWEVLDRLHASGWISDPATKAKSVVLFDEGEERSRKLFEKYFGASDEKPPKRSRG